MLDSPAHLPPLLRVLVMGEVGDLQAPGLELPAAIDHGLHVVREPGFLRPAHGDDRIAENEPLVARGKWLMARTVSLMAPEKK